MGARGKRASTESPPVADTDEDLVASGWAWSKLVGIDDYCWCDEANGSTNHDGQMDLRATGTVDQRHDTVLHLAQPLTHCSGHSFPFCRNPANGLRWRYDAGASAWVTANLHTVPILEEFDTSALVWNDLAGLDVGADVDEEIFKVTGSWGAGDDYYIYPALMNARRTYKETLGGTCYGFRVWTELGFESAPTYSRFYIPNSDITPKPSLQPNNNGWFTAGHGVG